MWLYIHAQVTSKLTCLYHQCTHAKSGGVISHHCCDPSVESCGLAGIHRRGNHHHRCHGDENQELVPENGLTLQLQFCPSTAQEDRYTNVQWNLY